MIIYNTTFHVEDDACDEFIRYMKDVYIPQAANGGFLFQPRLALVHAQHREGGLNYSLQFYVKNTDSLDYWHSTDGKRLNQALSDRFGHKVAGFTTLLEEIAL